MDKSTIINYLKGYLDSDTELQKLSVMDFDFEVIVQAMDDEIEDQAYEMLGKE